MTNWIYNYYMTAPDSHATALATLGAMLDPDTGGAKTFYLTLTTDGYIPSGANNPHLASVFPCTESIHQKLVAMNLFLLGQITLEQVPADLQAIVQDSAVQAMMVDLKWWRTARVAYGTYAQDELQAMRSGLSGDIGTTWTSAQAWTSLGLAPYYPSLQ